MDHEGNPAAEAGPPLLTTLLGRLVDRVVIVTDPEGTLTHSSAGADRLLGERVQASGPIDAMLDPEELVSTARRLQVEASFPDVARALLAAGETRVVWRLLSPCGRWHRLALTIDEVPASPCGRGGFALYGAVGPRLGPAAPLDDALQATLDRHVQEVRAFAEQQRRFLSATSHELRTPLTAIMGYVGILLDEAAELTDEHRTFLVSTERASQRLLAIVDDLITYERAESEELDLRPVPIALGDLIVAVGDGMGVRCAERSIDLVLPDATDPLPTVMVDPDRTTEILDHLLDNAVKFTPEGGTITVDVTPDEHAVAVSVVDTGVGIAVEDLPRVFDRFFRAESAVRAAVPGTGLGLAIARVLAEQQGGTLTVRSRVGEGAAFTLTLPRPGRTTEGG